jgi:hypothetical protein
MKKEPVHPEVQERARLTRALVRHCKKHGYVKMVLNLEDKGMRIEHRWTPAIEKRARCHRKAAGK